MGTLSKNRRPDIAVARVLGMVMIVLCHTLGFYTFIPGSQYAEQLLNVGVEIFLAISGFLYGTKTITHFGQWILKRAQRIIIPVAILSTIDFIVLQVFFNNHYPVTTIVAYLLNLQGLLFINWKFFGHWISEVENLGPIWFTTIIMICYLFVPLFQILRNRVKDEKKHLTYTFTILAVFSLSFVLQYFFDISIFYIAVFLVGYLLANLKVDNSEFKWTRCALLCLAITIAMSVRLISNHYIDGTKVYVCLIPLEYSIIGPSVMCLIMELNKKVPKLFNRIGSSKTFIFLDEISLYIYLTHGLFCRGQFSLYGRTNLLVSTMVFVLATVAIAKILWMSTDNINKIIEKAKAKQG